MFRIKQNKSDMSDAKLEPLFFARSMTTLKYCDSLPYENKPYQTMSPEAFATRNGFIWTDTIWAPPRIRDVLWEDTTHQKTAMTRIEDRLHNPLDSLAVHQMKGAGHGVFVAADAKPVPAVTLIGIYAGCLECVSPYRKQDHFTVNLGDEEHQSSALALELSSACVSANNYRNIVALINDAPDDFELEKISVSPFNAKANIATSNICLYPTIYNGCPICFAFTTRVLQPGEQLLLPYQGSFWNNMTRYVFNKNGETIGEFSSANRVIIHDSYHATPSMNAPRVDVNAVRPQMTALVRTPEMDTFDPVRRFREDINFALQVHLNRHVATTPEWKFINDLKNQFQNFTNPHHQLMLLQRSLDNPGIEPALISELRFAIKRYEKHHYLEVNYDPRSKEYLTRLHNVLDKEIVSTDAARRKVRLPIFWLRQLKDQQIDELSKELFVPQSELKKVK